MADNTNVALPYMASTINDSVIGQSILYKPNHLLCFWMNQAFEQMSWMSDWKTHSLTWF